MNREETEPLNMVRQTHCARRTRAGGSKCRLAIASATTLMLLAGTLHAGVVLHVDDDAGAGGDGLTWGSALRRSPGMPK